MTTIATTIIVKLYAIVSFGSVFCDGIVVVVVVAFAVGINSPDIAKAERPGEVASK